MLYSSFAPPCPERRPAAPFVSPLPPAAPWPAPPPPVFSHRPPPPPFTSLKCPNPWVPLIFSPRVPASPLALPSLVARQLVPPLSAKPLCTPPRKPLPSALMAPSTLTAPVARNATTPPLAPSHGPAMML